MGKPGSVPRVQTTITIDVALFLAAKEKGINLSRTMDMALRAVMRKGDDLTDEEVARLFREKNARIGEAVKEAIEEVADAGEDALRDLQHAWNAYVANSSDATASQKLDWIQSRREQYPSLKSKSNVQILAELQGTPV